MAYYQGITDQHGRKIEKALLTEEISAATITGVRSPLTGYPADGLNPERLATILKEADNANPLRFLELAETLEERDPHYAGVLGTRKRSVCQLEISVEPASDDPLHIEQADLVSQFLKRDELQDEMFNILDAVGKGYSFTEIIWDYSEKQWTPVKLEYRDPRWFRFDRVDGQAPMQLDEHGQEMPLPGAKYIFNVMRAKSGLPVRSGIARIVSWSWMFKMFTLRDWAIFTQNYGQPVRIGKYGQGATAEDRRTLFRAVANIAGDCAAIIPDTMEMEFVENKTGATSLDLYLTRANWFDQQNSKVVLGQTATTDAIAGGHAVGQEHRQVQEDIERADAKALSGIINRDLIAPWMKLQFNQDQDNPNVKIGRAEVKDVKMIVGAVKELVPLGMKVGQNQMRDIVGLGAPNDDDELLGAPENSEDDLPEDREAIELPPEPDDRDDEVDALAAKPDKQQNTPGSVANSITGQIGDAAGEAARPDIDRILSEIRELMQSAGSLDEVRAMMESRIVAGDSAISLADLEIAMKDAMLLAELTGRAAMR